MPLAAYKPLFAAPGVGRLVTTSLLARAAVSGLFDLPLILFVQDATGSYAVAGAALAAHALAIAISAPARGRLLDRLGSRRSLPPFVVVWAGSTVALPLAAETGQDWLLIALSGLGGLAMPALVAAMRLEWLRIFGHGDPRLAQAYSFDAASQVALYIAGPAIAGASVALFGAGATLVGIGVLGLVAGLGFSRTARAAPSEPAPDHGWLGPIRLRGLQTLVVIALFADTALGAIDVAVVAFAEGRGAPGLAGILLALFAVSGVAGGIVYGARFGHVRPASALVGLTALALLLVAPLALADSLWVLAILLLVAGVPSTAHWAARQLVLDRVTPGAAAGEAYTWLSTGNAAGVALGGLVAGALIEREGTEAAFLAAAAAVCLALVVSLLGRRQLDPGDESDARNPSMA